MKRIAIFALMLAVLVAPIIVLAQDPGSGAPIVEGNFSGSVNIGSMNPIRCGGTDCRRLNQLMYPTVVGVDPEAQSFGKMGQGSNYGGLATDWSVSDDGLVYTFTLRQDAVWTDGTPITARDVKFSFDAIASGLIDATTFSGYVDYSDANPNGIKEVRIVDDYTVEFVYGAAACDALNRGGFPVVPAAAFGYDDSPDFDFSVMVDNEFDTAPSVAFGPFQFANSNPGEAIGLKTVEDYVDGPVVSAGYIYRDVPDQTVLVEQFLAGESNFIDGAPQASRADIRGADGITAFDYPGISWDYVGLNLADPTNPQPGFDEAGNPIDQGNHPIFGDVRVRRAMQMAIDVPSIVQGAVFGEGTQMAANQIPTSWALDADLAPIAFDAEAAGALLDEAGWTLNSDGVRECHGCMYAEEGTPLEFTLITNQGNTRREAIGQIIQDQLSGLGIVVDFQPIDFNTLIDEVFGKQSFDAYILGWREGFPVDPDQTTLFTPAGDDPANTGNNGVSYNNPEVTRLMQEAGSVAGCAQEDRAELYKQIQRILLEDQPYLFLYVINGQYAAPDTVTNFNPYPNAWDWNVQTWAIAAE